MTHDMRQWLAFMSESVRNLTKGGTRCLGVNAEGPYVNVEDLVLQRGREYHSRALTDLEWSFVDKAIRKARKSGLRFRTGECFWNAQMLVKYGEHLEYVEGITRGTTIPMHHAWVTLNSKVIDLTWRWPEKLPQPRVSNMIPRDFRNRVYGELPPGWEYIGLPYTRLDVLKLHREWSDKHREYGPMFFAFHGAILKGKAV